MSERSGSGLTGSNEKRRDEKKQGGNGEDYGQREKIRGGDEGRRRWREGYVQNRDRTE